LLVRLLLLLVTVVLLGPPLGAACADVADHAEVVVGEAAADDDETRVTLDGDDGSAGPGRPVRLDELSPPTPVRTPLFRPPRDPFV
jgi:hypothetical protein